MRQSRAGASARLPPASRAWGASEARGGPLHLHDKDDLGIQTEMISGGVAQPDFQPELRKEVKRL